MTITEFLEARIAEDEAAAALHLKVWANADDDVDDFESAAQELSGHVNLTYDSEYMDMNIGYARVLAECAAKRAIIKHAQHLTEDKDAYWAYREYAERNLLFLAAVYADHPDYQREWTP